MRPFFLLIALNLLIHQAMLGQQISEWREENRTGISSETGLLPSWPEEGPPMIWKNLSLPKGYSSVSFGMNTIFTTGTVNEDDMLVALDMDGNILWQKVMGRAWDQSFPDSRATPTVEGDRVYTCSGFGDITCFNGSSGDIIWSYKGSELNKGTYGAWGIAESLLIDGEKIFFTPGGPETTMIALNKHTGEVIWTSESLGDKPGYVSPILVNHRDQKMVIQVSLGHVFGIDPDSGTILWNVAHENPRPGRDLIKCVTPLYHNGMVYVTGGYDTGGMMVKLAEDGESAEVVWTDDVLDVHHGGVILIDGYIYGANWLNNANGNWCCIEWETGEKMWEEHWQCKGSIIAAEGKIYIYEEKQGNIGLLNISPDKFDLVSSFQVTEGTSGPFWTHPVIHNGMLYLRHNNALMAFNIKSK